MRRQIKYEGELDLNGFKIPCYVLEDGTRVLSARAMQNSLKMVDKVTDGKQTAGTRLVRHLSQKSLKPFIFKDKGVDHFQPLDCYKGDAKINGYEATILADICEGFLEARKHIKLSKRQTTIADQAEILIRAFARVGIIALVDEATGYQYDREREELQKILKAYISPELLKWERKFPDVFYKELFRLNEWDFTVSGIKKRPGVIGTWTNKLIYEQLPKNVLKTLKEKTPKSEKGNYTARFFQSLTFDVGQPHLTAQINQVVTLFMLSDNMKDMWSKFKKLKDRQSGQLELPFKFDEEGHTKEPIYDEGTLSDFNQKLKKALEYKPKKDSISV
jgi:P63C domain